MQTNNDALLYVKNLGEISNELISECLNIQRGITCFSHSRFVNSLIFIDYQSDKTNMTTIQRSLVKSGINSRIIDM